MKICEVREETNETWVMVFYSIRIVQCTTIGVNIHGCMHPALPMVIFFLPSFSMLLLLTWVQFCAKCDFTEWLSLKLKQYPASLGQHGQF
jgi:hypothetical protein